MDPAAPTPAALLAALVASDPGRPRITCYDDTDGPTRGERVELSARVLANWVAKAGNLARDELDVEPGTVVRLDLPPHWRTLYWALAVWSLGAVVEIPGPRGPGGLTGDAGAATPGGAPGADDARAPTDSLDLIGPQEVADPPDVVVTSEPSPDDTHRAGLVVVTLAALARSAPVPVPAGAVDEAREIATHGDVLDLWDTPAPGDPALRAGGTVIRYGELVPAAGVPGEAAPRVHTSTRDTAVFLRIAVNACVAGGSVVLTRGEPDAELLDARLRAEGVTEQR
ncbi:MAG: TIGR03089 family protein [Dermatophilaceae bacterium]